MLLAVKLFSRRTTYLRWLSSAEVVRDLGGRRKAWRPPPASTVVDTAVHLSSGKRVHEATAATDMHSSQLSQQLPETGVSTVSQQLPETGVNTGEQLLSLGVSTVCLNSG